MMVNQNQFRYTKAQSSLKRNNRIIRQLAILLISFFLMNCQKVNSDLSHKTDLLVDSSMVWYISEYPNPCPWSTSPHKIKFEKDTIINNHSYKFIIDYCGDSIESNLTKGIHLGYIRETEDRKVYWYVKHFNEKATDILIYDFNAKVDDTIDQWVVQKIDSVKILNKYRKRLTLKSNCSNEPKFWIDGIGDMSDLLSYTSRTICDEESGTIIMHTGGSWFKQTCVMKGQDYIYRDSSCTECWVYKRCSEINNPFNK
jgi:hypothetical protein